MEKYTTYHDTTKYDGNIKQAYIDIVMQQCDKNDDLLPPRYIFDIEQIKDKDERIHNNILFDYKLGDFTISNSVDEIMDELIYAFTKLNTKLEIDSKQELVADRTLLNLANSIDADVSNDFIICSLQKLLLLANSYIDGAYKCDGKADYTKVYEMFFPFMKTYPEIHIIYDSFERELMFNLTSYKDLYTIMKSDGEYPDMSYKDYLLMCIIYSIKQFSLPFILDYMIAIFVILTVGKLMNDERVDESTLYYLTKDIYIVFMHFYSGVPRMLAADADPQKDAVKYYMYHAQSGIQAKLIMDIAESMINI